MTKDAAWWDKYDNGDLLGSSKGSGKSYGGTSYLGPAHVSCHESHQPLKLGDTGLVIHGGSCSSPKVKDADVYIGFDWSMRFTERQFPWTPGHELLYKIEDMHAPKEAVVFTQLIEWAAQQLQSGAKVHCGCIGGHGRTGLFFAALVKHMLGVEDAITYVREGYCHKAVESDEQIKWLGKHFAILPAKGTKSYVGKEVVGKGYSILGKSSGGKALVPVKDSGWQKPSKSGARVVKFVQDSNNIWGGRCS